MYAVELTRAAQRDIEALDRVAQERVVSRLAQLAQQPRPAGAEKLAGSSYVLYRLRVGDYRLIYTIVDEQRLVVVAAVSRRDQAYRDLGPYVDRILAYLEQRRPDPS